jgi:hypothetical protein
MPRFEELVDAASFGRVVRAERKERGLSQRELAQRVSCDDGSTYTSDNIMDYAYCYSDKLSQQQKERIRHVLNYCPTLPGPKLDSPASTRAAQAPWRRPRIVVCPAAPSFATTK